MNTTAHKIITSVTTTTKNSQVLKTSHQYNKEQIDKRGSKCHVNNVGDTCEEKGSKRMENNCIVQGK